MLRTSDVALLSLCITLLWLGTLSFSTHSNSCQQKMCKEAHVSAPLPFDCDTLPAHCYKANNLLKPNKSIKAFYNEVPVIYNHTMLFCPPALVTTSAFNNWRIEFQTTQNIYAVLLWRISPLDEPEKMTVKVVREVSSNLKESIECGFLHQYHNYHYFYCYYDDKLTSSYRLGTEGHTIEIKGNFFIDDTRDFTKSVKVYSYPVRLCAPPEAYENQTINPLHDYYYLGQQVGYKCHEAYKLVGNSIRTCKANGLWSGRVPICVTVKRVSPSYYYLQYDNRTQNKQQNSTYSAASNRHEALLLVPERIVNLEFQNEYCLKEVFVSFYTEPSQQSNISVTVASNNLVARYGNSNDESRVIKYEPEDRESYTCSNQILIERHRDKVKSSFVSAELILDVYGVGYEKPWYRCLNFSMFASYEFVKSPSRFTQNADTYALQCAKGFEAEEEYSPNRLAAVNCVNGTWKGHLPNCKRRFCPNPENNKFSSWMFKAKSDKELILTEIEYKCDDGFELEGESSSACVNGNWTSPPPVCQATYCPPIAKTKGRTMNVEGQFPDLVIKNGEGVLYHHGIRLQFQCGPGFYLIGNISTECVNRSWTAFPPMCKEILCDAPPFRVVGQENDTTYVKNWSVGDYKFSCPEGFAIESRTSENIFDVELHCQSNGRWLEEFDNFECVEQLKGLTTTQVALISTAAITGFAIIAVICYISIKRCKQWNKVVPLEVYDEWSTPTKELNEHLIQSSQMLVTTEGEHPHCADQAVSHS